MMLGGSIGLTLCGGWLNRLKRLQSIPLCANAHTIPQSDPLISPVLGWRLHAPLRWVVKPHPFPRSWKSLRHGRDYAGHAWPRRSHVAVAGSSSSNRVAKVIRPPRRHAAHTRRPPDLFGREGKAVNLCVIAEEVAGITYPMPEAGFPLFQFHYSCAGTAPDHAGYKYDPHMCENLGPYPIAGLNPC